MFNNVQLYLINKFNLNEGIIYSIENNFKNNIDSSKVVCEIYELLNKNNNEINIDVFKYKSYKELCIINKTLNDFFENNKNEKINENIIIKMQNENKCSIDINKDFSLLTEEEKIYVLSKIHEKYENMIFNIANISNPEKKYEAINKYIVTEKCLEKDLIEELELQKTFTLLKTLEDCESERQKKCKLRIFIETSNTSKANEQKKELDKIYEDNRLSMNKQDYLKYAYYHKGLDIDDFKKVMGNELYRCSESQLENYVDLWTKYQDNYISKDDFYYGKNVVFKEDISQECFKEDILPILQENSLSKKEINECINSSIDKGDEFFSELVELAETAHDNGYTDKEILTLIKDCEDEPISKIEEEIEIIKEKTDGSLDLEKLDDLTTDQIEMLNEITNDNLELDDGFELEFKNKRLF